MILACLVVLLGALPLQAVEKWALLIGVNDYTQISGLKGCENDVEMTRDLLSSRFGFPEDHIKTLLNAQATSQNIRQAIEDWLIARTQPEDIVYFHFSGHGSQLKDWEGDEDDGLDEVICPTDTRPSGANALTDDQLRELLDRIPAQHVTVVLDACHSGTGARDISRSRPRFVALDPELEKERATRAVVATPAPQALPPKNKLSGSGGMEAGKQQRVIISGCKAEETAADAWIREGFHAGALTYYLVENLKKVPPEITYNELMEQVARDIKVIYKQTPQIEGEADQPLFGVRVSGVASLPFLVVQSVQGEHVLLNGGSDQGVTQGSVYAVFPESEMAFQGAGIGRIKVYQVERNTSTALILDKAAIRKGCRAREIVHNHTAGKLKLLLESEEGTLIQPVQSALSRIEFVEVVGEGRHFDHRLQIHPAAGGLQATLTIDGAAGNRVGGTNADSLVQTLRPLLENAYAIKFLATLDNPVPPFKVEVWATRTAGANSGAQEQGPAEKLVPARIGDLLRLNFRADRDCYLTLINVGTSGQITVLFPNHHRPGGFISGNKVYQTETQGEMPFKIRVNGPAGRELVKIIATLEPLDLSSLRMGKEGAQGTRSIESGSSFAQQLARDLTTEGMEEGLLLPMDRWATDYLIVETIP